MVAPLWNLAKQESDFSWNSESIRAFERVHHEIRNITGRSYLNPNKKIVVQSDASGIGVRAVIFQDFSFTSRCLTSVEKRYLQIEREFLAIVFALRRFSPMLIGQRFELKTDHAPLLRILRKPLGSISNRMQRWVVSIQHYCFDVTHIKGVDNIIADALSRNPISLDPTSEEIAGVHCLFRTQIAVN